MHEKYACARVQAAGGAGGEAPLLNYTLRYFEEDCTTPRNVIDVAGGGKTNGFSFSGPAAEAPASWGAPLRGCLEGAGHSRGYGLEIECTQLCEVVSRDPPEPGAAAAGAEPCRDVAEPTGAPGGGGSEVYARARVRRWGGDAPGGAPGCPAARGGAAGAPAAEETYELGRCVPGAGGLAGGGAEVGSHRVRCGEGRDGVYGRPPRPVVHVSTYGDADCGDGSFRGARQWYLDGGGLACSHDAAAGDTVAVDCLGPEPAAAGARRGGRLPATIAAAAAGAVAALVLLGALLGRRRRLAGARALRHRMLLARAGAHGAAAAAGPGRRGTQSTYNPLAAPPAPPGGGA